MRLIICILMSINSVFAANKEIKEVFVEKAKLETIENKIIYPAEIKSRIYSEVKSQIDGIVEEFNIKLGQRVRPKNTILLLKNQDTTLSYLKNKISSPVSGVVSKILVSKGSFVSRGQTLFIVTEPSSTYVSVEVPVKDLNKINIGDEAVVNLKLIDKVYKAKLTGKGSLVNKLTGTVTCEFEFLDDVKLTSGILGRLELKTQSKKMMLVEESAVLYVGEKNFIRKIKKDQTVKKYEVKTGTKRNGKIQILKGLDSDETYVKRSNGYLIDGQKVKVIKK